jgi:hypothetical protein
MNALVIAVLSDECMIDLKGDVDGGARPRRRTRDPPD